jgi:hypothetical protein
MNALDPLAFDEATHTYRFMGAVVPGVTSILRPLSSFEGIAPAVLEAKARLGTEVHYACQLDDENDLDEDSVEPQVEPYLLAWRAFRRDTQCEVLAVEKRVFEPSLQFAGTLDRLLRIEGARWLVDLKTCFTTPITAGPQTAAYLRALGDTSVTRRAALRLRPDGTYRFDALTGVDDWSAFMACLTLHRFKESHAS